MVTGRKEVKNLILVISCLERYKQLTEYYKTKIKTALWLETKNKKQKRQDLSKLEASLAPAEAEVGAIAKADQ